jgi:hypothetical protein
MFDQAAGMPTESDSARTDDRAVLRVHGPGDLIDAVPYLLGFHPTQSLVLIGLADGQVVVTARIDLDTLAASDQLSTTVAAMCRGGARELVALVLDEREPPGPTLPWREVALAIAAESERRGASCGDVLFVSHGRWWSYSCTGAECCPAEGRLVGGAASAVAAAATYAGLVALPDRESVEALLQPLPVDTRNALAVRLAEAEAENVARILGGTGAREQRSVIRALFAAVRAAGRTRQGLTLREAEVVRFAVALRAYPVRDSVWTAIDDGRLDGRDLWRQLAGRLPGSYAAAPLFLFGWASWRAGDGALAGMAADRALDSDPGYTAADLLLAAVSHGINPRRMPRLRRAGA